MLYQPCFLAHFSPLRYLSNLFKNGKQIDYTEGKRCSCIALAFGVNADYQETLYLLSPAAAWIRKAIVRLCNPAGAAKVTEPPTPCALALKPLTGSVLSIGGRFPPLSA